MTQVTVGTLKKLLAELDDAMEVYLNKESLQMGPVSVPLRQKPTVQPPISQEGEHKTKRKMKVTAVKAHVTLRFIRVVEAAGVKVDPKSTIAFVDRHMEELVAASNITDYDYTSTLEQLVLFDDECAAEEKKASGVVQRQVADVTVLFADLGVTDTAYPYLPRFIRTHLDVYYPYTGPEYGQYKGVTLTKESVGIDIDTWTKQFLKEL
ncbi:Hypothetical protein POVN_LOCUS160 [uncultured virus]|nr:Hypothetical protein POVN_LOCUS160 [uncultured virus]